MKKQKKYIPKNRVEFVEMMKREYKDDDSLANYTASIVEKLGGFNPILHDSKALRALETLKASYSLEEICTALKAIS